MDKTHDIIYYRGSFPVHKHQNNIKLNKFKNCHILPQISLYIIFNLKTITIFYISFEMITIYKCDLKNWRKNNLRKIT